MAVDRQTLALLEMQKRLLGELTDQQVRDLAVAWARAWDEISTEMADAADIIAGMDRPTAGQILRVGQVRQALRVASDRLDLLAHAAGVRLSPGLQRAIRAGQTDTAALTRAQLPPSLQMRLARVDVRQLDAIVQRATEQITARHARLSADATAAMQRELTVATAVGKNPRTAARDMLRRVEGRFDGGLTRATVITRTEMLDAYRNGALEARKANPDIIRGWVWITSLSARTCRSCLAMHGTEHPADEPGPIDHHQGRCTSVPVTPSWRDLGIDLDEADSAIPDADRWFDSLDEAEQREILTDRGYDAWASGRYPREEWTQKRETPGWRDAQVPSVPPASDQGGSGGGRKLPGPPAPDPDGERRRRQAALGIETHGEQLELHEIEFVERFQRLGHRAEWIPRDRSAAMPTNDFVWIDNGRIEMELKSTKAKHATIRGHIERSVRKAEQRSVTKANFMIDIGEEVLTDDLLTELAGYNTGRRKYLIRGLWVMHSNGRLAEIPIAR